MGKTHKFTIGDISCIALEEGTVSFDPESIPQRYPNATGDEIKDALDSMGYDGGEMENYFNARYITLDTEWKPID